MCRFTWNHLLEPMFGFLLSEPLTGLAISSGQGLQTASNKVQKQSQARSVQLFLSLSCCLASPVCYLVISWVLLRVVQCTYMRVIKIVKC